MRYLGSIVQVQLRPRSDLLAVVRTSGDSNEPGGCGCTSAKDVVDTLRLLGMQHAAYMHAKGSAYPWTPRDWYSHALEEDRRLFPLLLIVARSLPAQSRTALESDVASLRKDHDTIIYPAVAKNELPPIDLMKAHGAKEDALVRRYRVQLLRAAGRNVRGEPVQVGADYGGFTRVPVTPAFSNSGGGSGAVTQVTSVEKFMDPLFSCFGQNIGPEATLDMDLPPGDSIVPPYEIYPNAFGIPRDLGFDYLSVPNNAAARIGAIRAHMGATPAGSMVTFDKKKTLGAIADASFNQIQRISTSLISAYQDVKNYDNIAATFRIPVAQVEAQAAGVLKAGSEDLQSRFIEKTAKYQPIATMISSAIALAVRGGSWTTGEAVSFVGNALAGAMGSMVPIFGDVIRLETKGITDWLDAKKIEAAEADKAFYDHIKDLTAQFGEQQFPVPWHAFDDLKVSSGVERDSSDQGQILQYAYSDSLEKFRSLTPIDFTAVKQWWNIASALASHPDVYNAMNKLGHGIGVAGPSPIHAGVNGVGMYTGLLASDEQVMLVALPIAIANGLDPDIFARALWNRSKGWRGANQTSIDNGTRPEGIQIGLFDGKGGSAGVLSTCPNYVSNAWWLNWAVLARDAMKLASEMTGQYAPPPPDIFGFGASAWWPAFFGVAASAGFYALSAPLWLTALPAILGVGATVALRERA